MKQLKLLVSVMIVMIGCGTEDKQSVSNMPALKGDDLRFTLEYSDYTPSAAAQKARVPMAEESQYATMRGAAVVQQGEIVVMEGTAQLVSQLPDNKYGVVMSNQVQNPVQITKALLSQYADEFDSVCVFTTFPDGGAANSVAYALPIKQDVKGLGMQLKDNSPYFGSKGSLYTFINMQYVGKYGNNLGSPNHWIHSVMAQEFAHRWGTFLKYVDSSGTKSTALLGRDGAHWANNVQAYGSVMDGHEWEDLGTGSYRLKAKNYRFSPLDQYTMGLRAASEVEDFYRIQNMSYQGKQVPPYYELPKGIYVSGKREDITMDQIVKANGDRIPSAKDSPKDFRMAIVLLTTPQESAADVQSYVDKLEAFRKTFEQRVNQISDGRMRVCTQVSGPCDAAGVTLDSYEVIEEEGNNDGTIDPGETVAINITVRSTGVGPAPEVVAELAAPNIETLNIIKPVIEVGDVAEKSSKTSPEPFLIKIPPTQGCGDFAEIPVSLLTDNRTFPAQIQFEIGVNSLVLDEFESPDDWTLNPYGTDTVKAGAWEIGEPAGVDANYVGVPLVTQPSQDHSENGANALVTGRKAGYIGDNDVDGGITTALSPVYNTKGARDPLLTWYTWHFSHEFNFKQGKVVPQTNDALITEASTDGGKTWVIIDKDVSNTQKWERKEVRLKDYVTITDQLQLRITMADDPPQTLAEAMVDDIRIWDESLICRPDLEQPKPSEEETPEETSTDDADDDVTSSGSGAAEIPKQKSDIDISAGEDSSGCQAGHGQSTAPLGILLMLLVMLSVLRRRVT